MQQGQQNLGAASTRQLPSLACHIILRPPFGMNGHVSSAFQNQISVRVMSKSGAGCEGLQGFGVEAAALDCGIEDRSTVPPPHSKTRRVCSPRFAGVTWPSHSTVLQQLKRLGFSA